MSEFAAEIEAFEHRIQRSWMRGEKRDLKQILSRDFIFVVGAARAQFLDRPSFLEACDRDLVCSGYRMREVSARKHGKCAWFAAAIDLEMRLCGEKWEGAFWLADLWRKNRLGKGWKLLERSLSRAESSEKVPAHFRSLQLWN